MEGGAGRKRGASEMQRGLDIIVLFCTTKPQYILIQHCICAFLKSKLFCVCLYVHMYLQSPEKRIGSQELEMQVAVSCLIQVLGTELRSLKEEAS